MSTIECPCIATPRSARAAAAPPFAMEMVSEAKKRTRTHEEEEEQHEDRISSLPDGVLGDIVSFLPTRDGARTQLLSSRWRHLWRSSPLHLGLENGIAASEISRILSAHPGPGRRFSVPEDCFDYRDSPDVTTIDSWFRSPALDGLQELEFHHASHPYSPPPSQPASVHRFSSTLRVASFGGFGFPDRDGGASAGGAANGLHLPVLQQLSLTDVRISASSLRALLAACPVLQSLLLDGRIGCSRVEFASPTLRSIGMCSGMGLQQIVIQDAPCLERLLLDSYGFGCYEIAVSVISAPKLHALGPLSAHGIRLEFGFGTTIVQTMVHSVKILALIQVDLSLDAVIESMKCFPCLEKLYIKTKMAGQKNMWCRKYKKDFVSSLDIRLKKIVLTEYRGNKSHVNFAKFFVLNARMLEYMRLDLYYRNPSSAWIDKQHRLLQIKNRASRDMQLDFASSYRSYFLICNEQVHDLSAADPFS